MKVIIIEKGKAPYEKEFDLEKYDNNMNAFAESEIGCNFIDRIYLLPEYELTIYVDDTNADRPDSEFNFAIPGTYLLPVKGKAIVSRAVAYGEEIDYQDTTKEDLKFLEKLIIR